MEGGVGGIVCQDGWRIKEITETGCTDWSDALAINDLFLALGMVQRRGGACIGRNMVNMEKPGRRQRGYSWMW